jgi:hypothetical protein
MNTDDNFNAEILHEKYGIITAILIDPLSLLTSKILKLKDMDHNSIGFYYISDIVGEKKYTIFMFNIYDNSPISWLKFGCSMDSFLSSDFVKQITFYPFCNLLLSTKQLQNKDSFRATVIDTISLNSKHIHNKENSFKRILTGTNTTNLITGYSLINRCLLILMGNKTATIYTNPNNIIQCSLLKKPITISSKETSIGNTKNINPTNKKEINPTNTQNINPTNTKYILDESKKDIKLLFDVAFDLFINNEDFRTRIFSQEENELLRLFTMETELINFFTKGIEKGTIDNGVLNKFVLDINTQCAKLGYSNILNKINNPPDNIKIVNSNLPYTLQHPQIRNNINDVKELGLQLSNIVELFKQEDTIIIPLGNIISLYNNIIDGTDLKKIKLDKDTNLISKQAVITLPSSDDLLITHNNICIPMYNANLTQFTEYELMDILVYIDSLKPNNIRFANIQNEITHELALRKT